jgi:hypothetical protein
MEAGSNPYKKVYNNQPLRTGGIRMLSASDSAAFTSSSASASSSSSSSSSSMESAILDYRQLPTLARANTYGQLARRALEVTMKAERDFICDHAGCGSVFQAKQNLATHMRRFHKPTTLACPRPGCNKTYKHR